jgi:MFS family permease
MHSPSSSIESRTSWTIATLALVTMCMAFGSSWITAVALTNIAAEVDGARSIPAIAASLTWFGMGVGGILMGRVAHKIGVRWTVGFGALMIAVGLAISTLGAPWPLWIGHGVFIGLFGIGAINAPLYIYVTQWFDKRRGSALALITSGSYIAGAIWPPIFERSVAHIGWRGTMLAYGALMILVSVPLAWRLAQPPELTQTKAQAGATPARPIRLGLPPNLAFTLLCIAGVMCCIPMAMPQQHLVAFCSDVGLSLATGAAMLSVLLGTAFVSRQVWGLISDRIGGLMTILLGSVAQTLAVAGFTMTQDEIGLFAVSAAFGMGFSAIIPAYALAIREMFPAGEAYWRIPTVLMCTGVGMAIGGWFAGYLYDYFGYYLPAFAAGVVANVLNFTIVGFLVWRRMRANPPSAILPLATA